MSELEAMPGNGSKKGDNPNPEGAGGKSNKIIDKVDNINLIKTQNKNEGDNISSIKKVTEPKRGKSNKIIDKVDNINLINKEPKPKGGTSPSYLTKRLKRDAPELFSKVASGEFFMFICFLSGGFGCCRAGKFNEHSV